MTLPGKVTIGYLEEDLPQKAYFRIKPLFVSGDGVFERVEDARGEFPDEGGEYRAIRASQRFREPV